jgi:integrase
MPADLATNPPTGDVALPVDGAMKLVKVGAMVKVSLGTKDHIEAKRRFRDADAALQEFWHRHREGPQPLTHKQVQALAGKLYDELVAIMDSEPGESGIWSEVIRLNAGKAERRQLDPWFGPSVDALFAKEGVNADPLSRTRVVHAAFKAIQLAAETNLRKAEGDYTPDDAARRFPAWEPQAQSQKLRQTAPAGAFDLFALLDHKFATQSLKVKTKDDYARDLKKFVASSGKRDAREITKDDVRQWRDRLIAEDLSPKKINGKCLAALSGVLTHAVNEFSLPENVAHGIRDQREGPAPGRKGYNAEEAKAILSATFNGTGKEISAPHRRALFWVPWICAYTGLRVTEITQLRGKHVKEEGGHHFFMITPEDGSTKSGRAWNVAVHPHLVELGVLEMFKAVGDGPAFYVPYPDDTDLSRLSSKHRAQDAGNRVGNWITNELCIPAPGGKPNHAWRHLFTSLSRVHKIDKQARDYMLGSGREDAREGYGDWPPDALTPEIAKLPRFDAKDTGWRPSNEKVPAQTVREGWRKTVRKGTKGRGQSA